MPSQASTANPSNLNRLQQTAFNSSSVITKYNMLVHQLESRLKEALHRLKESNALIVKLRAQLNEQKWQNFTAEVALQNQVYELMNQISEIRQNNPHEQIVVCDNLSTFTPQPYFMSDDPELANKENVQLRNLNTGFHGEYGLMEPVEQNILGLPSQPDQPLWSTMLYPNSCLYPFNNYSSNEAADSESFTSVAKGFRSHSICTIATEACRSHC